MVRVNQGLSVRPYARHDLTPMRNLTFYNFRVHTHLDWQTIHEYLLSAPPHLWVAYRNGYLVGTLGLSEPINRTCWVRVLAVADNEDTHAVLRALWDAVRPYLREAHIETVAVLLMRDWVRLWAQQLGFGYTEDIVTLRYHRRRPPLAPPSTTVTIRPIEHDQLPAVHAVDAAAFNDPWRMTLHEVRLGVRTSAYSTVALADGAVVGYQIATTHGLNGHLARLGVAPAHQGRGVGGALVHDMIAHFHAIGIHAITVNTQDSNTRSQRLYERFGFARNGYDLPVWTIRL